MSWLSTPRSTSSGLVNDVYCRERFILPKGSIYFAGNSLGPCLEDVADILVNECEQNWGYAIDGAWKRHGWLEGASRIGDKIARLIGAQAGTVFVCDNTSVNIYKALRGLLRTTPGRSIILTDEGNFPTDVYVAQGLVAQGIASSVKRVARNNIPKAIDESVGILLLSHVDFRTGERYDLPAISKKARAFGVKTLWDLSHSVGVSKVDVSSCDIAVGCGYKYLNGGPGAPAYIYLSDQLDIDCENPIWGWLGHRDPFDFESDYRAAEGAGRFVVGTPPVFSQVCLEASVDHLLTFDISDVDARSSCLKQQFIADIASQLANKVEVLQPDQELSNGGHLSIRVEDSETLYNRLRGEKIVPEKMKGDVLRFAFNPLYICKADIDRTVEVIAGLLNQRGAA